MHIGLSLLRKHAPYNIVTYLIIESVCSSPKFVEKNKAALKWLNADFITNLSKTINILLLQFPLIFDLKKC